MRDTQRKILADSGGTAPAVTGTPGEIERMRRVEAGLTQEQLAELSGLGAGTISDIERGATLRPSQSSMALLDTALDLAGGDGAVPGPGSHDRAFSLAVPRQLPPAVSGFVGRG